MAIAVSEGGIPIEQMASGTKSKAPNEDVDEEWDDHKSWNTEHDHGEQTIKRWKRHC